MARRLTREIQTLESVANVVSDVSEARDEIDVDVDPSRAAALGLDARQAALQVNTGSWGKKIQR